MNSSMVSPTRKINSKKNILKVASIILIVLALLSLLVGKYKLTLTGLLSGEEMMVKVFWMLRLPRLVMAIVAGFALGIAGFVFQLVFRNPLASPDIIGISSGASAGAAFGILFCSGFLLTTICSFVGALLAVVFSIVLSTIDRSGEKNSIVLAGIVVHSIAQSVLMVLKLMADPEKQLASIEYWIMGSLNGITSNSLVGNIVIVVISLAILLLMHRQIILLSEDEQQAKMLGVSVSKLRLVVLVTTTLAVSATVSLTGLISFIGLLAPHIGKLIMKDNKLETMILSGMVGSIILLVADILARSVSSHELPISIFTSLLGAPFLIYLLFNSKRRIQ